MLVDIKSYAIIWNYYINKSVLTQKNFSNNLDTILLDLTITNITPEIAD